MTDPTNTITTAGQARVLAHAMLRLAPEPAAELCQLFSEPILTALLHTASPAGDGGGLAAVVAALQTLADRDGPAPSATPSPNTTAQQGFSHLAALPDGQRAAVIGAMRDAVAPWLAA